MIRRGERERLPNRTRTEGVKAKLRDSKVYIHTSRLPSGAFGEVFVDMAKEGDLDRGLMHTIAKLISIAVQHGTPLEEIVDSMLHTKFEPAGPVYEHPRIKFCDSLVDLLARHLAIEFLGREDLAHVPNDEPEVAGSRCNCGIGDDSLNPHGQFCPRSKEDEGPGEGGVREPAGPGPRGGPVDALDGYALASAAVG
jgi:ribonucleoside-diphosphate reductase alpha chain